MRDPFKVDVVRDRASLARIVGEGQVENVYRLQVMNASEAPQRYRITATGLAGATVVDVGDAVDVESAQARWIPLAVRIPFETARSAGSGAHPLTFHIEQLASTQSDTLTVTEKTTFLVPR